MLPNRLNLNMASAGARAYNGGMGRSAIGAQGHSLWSGAKPPEADRLYRNGTSKIRGKITSFQFFPVF